NYRRDDHHSPLLKFRNNSITSGTFSRRMCLYKQRMAPAKGKRRIEMFEKMIETGTAENQFKGRKRYFLFSGVVVGALFLSTVLISIYAAEYSIELGDINTAELLAPVITDAPEPKLPEAPAQASSPDKTVLPTRRSNMARVHEVQHVPDGISTAQNTLRARPDASRLNITNGPETDGIGPYRPNGGDRAITGTSSGGLKDKNVAA